MSYVSISILDNSIHFFIPQYKNLKIFGIVILASLVLYGAALLILYLRQHNFIFYPTVLSQGYPFSEFSNVKEIILKRTPHSLWHALHFQVEDPKGIVLYFHGNTGDISTWGHNAEIFRKLRYAVLMPDYPGYGKSQGRLTEKQINNQALSAYNWALNYFSAENIILLGRSLGTGPATQLATQVESKLLILETPYTSIPDMGKEIMKIFPVEGMLKFRFNNFKKITKTKAPVFIFHGTKDELIPFAMAKKIAAEKGKLITLSDAGHNNFHEFELYKEQIVKILL